MIENTDLPELPKTWLWVRIGDIADIITGNTPSKKDSTNYGDYLPFVKPPELNDNKINSANDNLSKKGAELGRVIPPKSILVSCIGNLGKTGMNLVPVAFNQQINAIVLPKEIVPEYGFYFFQTVLIKRWLDGLASATTISIVNKAKFQTLYLPICPQNEQKRIVDKIEELFTKLNAGVEELKKIQSQLNVYHQAILKVAYNGKLTEKWRKKHVAISDTDFKWKSAKISEIGELISGQHILKNDYNHEKKGIPYLTGPADFGDIYPFISRWTEHPKAVAKNGDILVTVKGAGVGKTNILNIDDVCISRQLMAIRTSEIDPKFIFYFLLSNFPMLQKLGAGSTVPGIDRKSILNLNIPTPDRQEQKIVVEEIERYFSVVNELNETVSFILKKSVSLKHSIFNKAYNGQLVPQDPLDEPAEFLLKRIKNENGKYEQMRLT